MGCDRDTTNRTETGNPTPAEAAVHELWAEVHSEIGSIITVDWSQIGASTASVRYSFDEGVWHETPVQEFERGNHQLLLLGIPYATKLSWQMVWEDECGTHTSELQSITTDLLPDNAPQVSQLEAMEGAWDPDMPYVLTSMDGTGLKDESFVMILDRQGRIVWLKRIPAFRISLHPRVSQDGTELLLDYGSFWSIYDGGINSQVARVRIDGTEVHLYDTPGLHHPFTDLPDGSILWGAYKGLHETLQQVGSDGIEETLFDCGDHFESIGEEDPCASNTLYWDADREVLLYSLYTVDSILEINLDRGEVEQTYGHIAGAWDFEPEEGTFWWQHGIHTLEDGNFLLSCQVEGTEILVAREYERDAENQVLRQVWSHGQDAGIESSSMGEAHRLPSGNTLHNYGTTPRLREFTAEGESVWDLQWEGDYIGRSTPISDLYDFAGALGSSASTE